MTRLMTSRDATRRWYGQIQNQPPRITENLAVLAAHTIIPGPDLSRSTFSAADFAPLNGVIDLVLHTRVNDSSEITGLAVRGYKSSYNPDNNQFAVGGADNFLFSKEFSQRPYKGAKNQIIDSEAELAVLSAGLEMDAEREISTWRDDILSTPRFADAVMSFNEEDAPSYNVTTGLKSLAWQMLMAGATPFRALCAPTGANHLVKRILKDEKLGVTLIELDSEKGCVFEVPSWAKLHVKNGSTHIGGRPVASLTVSRDVTMPIYRANKTMDSAWTALSAVIGERDANQVLKLTWESYVTQWAGMTMIPHHILSPEQLQKTTGVWRDLRGSLHRQCHNHQDPMMIIRTGPREGKITVWDIGSVHNVDQALKFRLPGGTVDLFSEPESIVKLPEVLMQPTVNPAEAA